MKADLLSVFIILGASLSGWSQVAVNLVAEGIPPIPDAITSQAQRYLEFRTASFQSWHPLQREMLITTRFADTVQMMPFGPAWLSLKRSLQYRHSSGFR